MVRQADDEITTSPPSPPTSSKRGVWPMRGMRLGKRREGRRRHRRKLPPVSVLPTLCTLGNLIAGFASIHYASRVGDVRWLWKDWTPLALAGALVFLGILLDAIDGALARLTRSNSEIGAQLDSLADVVTFGVAPAFMTIQLVRVYLESEGWIIGPGADTILGRVIWGAAAVYVSCAALRLARYNVESGLSSTYDRNYFRGLPSPGAAGAIASLVMLHQHLVVKFPDGDVPGSFIRGSAIGIPFIMLLCGVAMVSTIPYLHVANRYVRGRRNFPYIVRLVVLLALAVWLYQYALPLVLTVYVLTGPIGWMVRRVRRRFAVAPAAAEPGTSLK